MSRHFVSSVEEPELHFLLRHLAEQAQTAPPRLMLMEDDDPMIYSTGSPAYLVISEGSLHQLSCEEFERRVLLELRCLRANRSSTAIQ